MVLKVANRLTKAELVASKSIPTHASLHTVHYQPTRKGQKPIGGADRIWRGIRSIGNCVVAFGDGKLPKRQSDFTKLVLRVFECLFIPWRFW